jgi:hypothetical protein
MFALLLNTRTEWNDYFPGISQSRTLGSKEYTTTQTTSNQNVYVSNCLFNKCKSTSSGGALSCTSVPYLLIESSSFFSCNTSSSYGGAICVTGSNECVLYNVCGDDCSTCTSSTDGQFAYLSVNNAASNRNYFNYSSISRSVSEYSSSCRTLRLYYGKNLCSSVNISMNRCQYQTILQSHPYSDSNSVISSLTYSSFVDNNSTVDNCLYLGYSVAKFEIKCCNILRNKHVDRASRGTICTTGILMIEDSCILENNANCIIYSTSTSYTITLSNCTIDSMGSNTKLILTNTAIKSFIHALRHMSTQNCYAVYDSVGSLTAVPSPPPEKGICNYTCEKFRYRASVSDFFTFIGLFIVAFIHTYN